MKVRTRNNLLLATGVAGACVAARWAERFSRRLSLHGKTVFITGGSRGLGLVLAREYVAMGAKVAICARDGSELERAEFDLVRRGGDVLAFRCDVTDREQVAAAVERVVDRFGSLDVLVNNAGVISVGPMDLMTVDDYAEAMRTHFWGPLYTTMAALPHLRLAAAQSGGARIVNISSVGGKLAAPHMLPYSASKFALTGFSEGLRNELARDKVMVTTVCPGLMRTGSPRNAFFKGKHHEEYVWFNVADSLPLSSMGAQRAARKIVSACRHGDAELILSLPAKAAVLFHDLCPEIFADLAGLMNRLLPTTGGIGSERVTGAQSETALTQSWVTALTQRAARENNEID